ncbi:MAG: TRAP transporter fused permease subunit [Armatimonadota bacterium]|nr:TRAP transporter fused permease subunit [Armatimonadota bacterium]MDR7448886.1 TRAP transporter fused permease subunit [Armatimonadota bacterium]MDR7460139.1 TRAP transporter fused permease subunit [Armatimonadota bacterium]MDR7479234.1 TRAP transporter fused permease subunit [Armatimonadota bacterium]MDR7487854.1 TRAP transporter fused permease subunit [Armatimonadota bacterium]
MMSRLLALACRGTALAFALVFLAAAWRGGMDLFVQRGLFLLFALLLVFLGPMARAGRLRPAETVLALLAVVGTGYVILAHERIAYQAGIATRGQLVLAALLVLVVLEATRRLIGWVLPALVLLMVAYALFGRAIPGNWGHAGFSLANVLGYLYLTPDGLWSLPLGVAATYIITFVVLGEFVARAGIADLLSTLAMRVAGRVRGGPAQVSVLGSLGFGMVSGSAPANVAIDGAVTIPLMKRYGFPPPLAAGIELASSAGGQLMPPVMGAAAFLIVELLRVRYVDVASAALLPALLYYLGVGASVYFVAGALGLRGLSRSELDQGFLPVRQALARRGHLLLPLVVLVYLVLTGWYAPRAAAVAVVVTALVAALHPATRLGLRGLAGALADGGVRTLEAAMGTAASALIFSMIVFTGIGVKFSTLAVQAAGGNVLVLLALVVLATLLLGLALPTTASYLIAAATVAPALEQVGIPPLAAHLFIFYYSVLATITPPEGMALFTASAIAGSNWMETGLAGMKMTLSGYLVPFGFVVIPTLLLRGDPLDILLHVTTAAVGVVFLSAGAMGFLLRPLRPLERLVLVAGAALLFHPSWAASLGGLALCGLLTARQAAARTAARPAPEPETSSS